MAIQVVEVKEVERFALFERVNGSMLSITFDEEIAAHIFASYFYNLERWNFGLSSKLYHEFDFQERMRAAIDTFLDEFAPWESDLHVNRILCADWLKLFSGDSEPGEQIWEAGGGSYTTEKAPPPYTYDLLLNDYRDCTDQTRVIDEAFEDWLNLPRNRYYIQGE